ncbi:helix-turn-helix domain-containing protein [Petroclostridium sp. X23]|uniref:helix-turn-helix transcriptional regulator n=1 Tax=Petroclostridium sp. X23 TaxID=3045146 RepID=UPI0024AD3122|nr:helix-turn-helix domain-containing protein [Petroclostridium sp. X23]WHH59119.1 helix-turn-helix domain-containing protein [Petroclostridium sp. X23]
MRQYLIKLRKEIKKTQLDVSTDLGISRAFYAMIENGTRNPNLNLANNIAQYFNDDVNKIFFDDKSNETLQNQCNKTA